jgi:DNA polymerase-1
MPPILYLIDGHALAYRSYFALTAGGGGERLQTSSGEPTAGTFGFASILLRLLEKEQPEYLAVAFDTGKTFRNDLYPEYKATRAKMPDDLRPQVERIRKMVDAFHIPRLEKEGVEADDVLGTMAVQAVAQGMGVKIITGDRDLLQLVNERVIVNLPGAKMSDAKDYTAREVREMWGIAPEQVVDYKALVGDHSDNIPGVPGVGEKTAVALLEQFPTLDEIYAHLDETPTRVRAKLEAGRDLAYLSRTLATIRTDVGLKLDLEDARTTHLDFAAAESMFRELEFRTLLGRLSALRSRAGVAPAAGEQLTLFGTPVHQIGAPEKVNIEVVVVDTPTALSDLASTLSSAAEIALDTETTGTDPLRSAVVGISLAVREGQGYYIPLGHRSGEPQLPVGEVIDALRPALTNPAIQKIGHNLKYDWLVLAELGLEVAPLSFDTMLAEWLLDPSSRHLGLKDMAEIYLGVEMTHITELIGSGKNQQTMADVSVASAAPYAAADAEVTLRLAALLRPRLPQRNVEAIFTSMEMPLVSVLANMEQNGILVDVAYLAEMTRQLAARLSEIEIQITTAVGHPFNLNSTQQLSDVLFKELGLKPPDARKTTASGKFSTSADVLEELRGQHVVVDLILEYRELSKIKSTYLDALPAVVNPRTGRVHTSFNQTGSVTGRLSSSDPNLQNIPTRSEIGRQVRKAFIAADGWTLLSVDYSQIELRIVAHMSNDDAMISAFRRGEDIHAATAAAIYGIPIETVDKDKRRHAKAINFGLIYGMSAFGLSRGTGLTLGEAEDFVQAYFTQFPGVKAYLDGLRKSAAQLGYVETMFGRRRYFPNLQSGANPALRAREEREAINAPIQGTAADLLKVAMIALPAALQAEGVQARMLLQVHDELVLETPAAQLQATARIVRHTMENVAKLAVPLSTEARSGRTWGDMQVLEQ